ncbi:MAG: hypothetical protein LBD99_04880, partial [Candidatus Margulisbacteria bacterium]|nr:hypothetical protein [Candidatus Margulisiibacteriota bacterium]
MTVAQKSKILASDILGLTFFPAGAILAIDGTVTPAKDDDDVVIGASINNTILPDWYICDGENNTPDLREKFIMGSSAAGSTGGNNNKPVSLSAENLPSHTHGVTDGGHVHGGKMLRGRIHDGRRVGSASCADGLWEGDTSPAKTGISLGSAGETNPSPVE